MQTFHAAYGHCCVTTVVHQDDNDNDNELELDYPALQRFVALENRGYLMAVQRGATTVTRRDDNDGNDNDNHHHHHHGDQEHNNNNDGSHSEDDDDDQQEKEEASDDKDNHQHGSGGGGGGSDGTIKVEDDDTATMNTTTIIPNTMPMPMPILEEHQPIYKRNFALLQSLGFCFDHQLIQARDDLVEKEQAHQRVALKKKTTSLGQLEAAQNDKTKVRELMAMARAKAKEADLELKEVSQMNEYEWNRMNE